MTKNKITIHATVLADSRRAWDCYTLPEHITKWNFASDDWHCPDASNDLRPGGRYVARMEAKDGSFGFDFEAVYQEVIEGRKIVHTMPNGRQTEILFQPAGDSTEITITFDAENEHPLEMQRDGWQAILNNFRKYTEG